MREGRRRAGLERMWEREKGKPEKRGGLTLSTHTPSTKPSVWCRHAKRQQVFEYEL